MNQEYPVRVENVTKTYKQYNTELKRVASWFGMSFKASQEFEALKNVSFEIASQQGVGIIGRNGAGKSTLLKIIAGTAYPTSGQVHIRGVVTSHVLGLGFDSGFSGLENAKNSLSLRGLSRKEVEALIPYVEDFAELGKYFHEATRTYSSGMNARLMFAVATAIRPEILIVDEGLAVGDTYFAKKSYDRMLEFRSSGTSFLLSAHGKSNPIEELCDRVILLEKGEVLVDGSPAEAFREYEWIEKTR
jgi:lipopolysaccharide transport system ATP-binding protein